MEFFMGSMVGEIQRRSDDGDLMIWNKTQSSRRKHDTQVSRFNTPKLDDDQMVVIKWQ